MKQRKTKAVTEFGDFQTPRQLARSAVRVLARLDIRPHCVLEPTCGQGAFVCAIAEVFPDAKLIVGVDINHTHLAAARKALQESHPKTEPYIKLKHGNFFDTDWSKVLAEGAEPWLIVGNPPWVTSAGLGAIESDNLPEKSNFHGRIGIEAITGKSNFDISEWMLLRYLDWLEGHMGTIAVLCKTAIARKILLHVWKKNIPVHSASIYKIDALAQFGAAVDACFFVLEIKPQSYSLSCDMFDSLEDEAPSNTLGFLGGHIISNVAAFNRQRRLLGQDEHYVWRSGIKHDCSKIMELVLTPNGYRNGLGEVAALEDTFLFPMLKGSDVGNGRLTCRGAMLVTQRTVGEDTAHIRLEAPETWKYLRRYATLLDKRGGVIYKNKPHFSIFGVGPYSFAPWKVAISGFYKALNFAVVGPVEERPVVFDDTIYFLPCWSEDEARFLKILLDSEAAREFFHSMIH